MSFSIMPSHPDFERLNDLQNMLVVATNPAMFWQGIKHNDLDNIERLAIIDTLESEIEQFIEIPVHFNGLLDMLTEHIEFNLDLRK